MTLTINDDLSGLLYLRVGAGAKVETREWKEEQQWQGLLRNIILK